MLIVNHLARLIKVSPKSHDPHPPKIIASLPASRLSKISNSYSELESRIKLLLRMRALKWCVIQFLRKYRDFTLFQVVLRDYDHMTPELQTLDYYCISSIPRDPKSKIQNSGVRGMES